MTVRYPRNEQPWAGRRGKRRGDLELGVIGTARPVPGIGPGVIEDIFALAVAFQISWKCGDNLPAVIRNRNWRR